MDEARTFQCLAALPRTEACTFECLGIPSHGPQHVLFIALLLCHLATGLARTFQYLAIFLWSTAYTFQCVDKLSQAETRTSVPCYLSTGRGTCVSVHYYLATGWDTYVSVPCHLATLPQTEIRTFQCQATLPQAYFLTKCKTRKYRKKGRLF